MNMYLYFLLLARCVPNVAKRSIWHQCKCTLTTDDHRPTEDRPSATDLAISVEHFEWLLSL